jgi:hypothetical protein
MESEVKCPAPKLKTDGPIVRALFERALAGPPKKKTKKVDRGPVVSALAGPAPKKGTPVAEVKKE